MTVEQHLPAGEFSAWLAAMQRALRGEDDSDVPCDGCTACCRASQFVHIGPEETETLAAIPAELLFPAPGRPDGHVLLGYDEHGHCPMLIDDRCSIYARRPRACRTYDCRIFPATGVEADEDDEDDGSKGEIGRRSRRWRFSYPTEADRRQHDAVRATAMHLRHRERASTPTQLAVAAIEVDATTRADQA